MSIWKSLTNITKFIATGERPVRHVLTPSEKADAEIREIVRKGREQIARHIRTAPRYSRRPKGF
jgi:hypothetical protein